MSLINLTPSQLRHAADLKEKIEALQLQLDSLHGDSDSGAAATPAGRGRRKISAAGIARIRAAQKLRWAKAKGKTAAGKPGKRGPRKMSAAARAKIAAAQKKRWAAFHAAKAAK